MRILALLFIIYPTCFLLAQENKSDIQVTVREKIYCDLFSFKRIDSVLYQQIRAIIITSGMKGELKKFELRSKKGRLKLESRNYFYLFNRLKMINYEELMTEFNSGYYNSNDKLRYVASFVYIEEDVPNNCK